ncbi:hypothetical protein PILCRDRAFT_692915 [Piloderma croceum F 1598]|uniref:Uncharacterized protein n=1 Tax=Piloderma croceum (strain F 1598) TaxID=765440 RepID=A0A0C3F4R9_PILCF|nr:hypothetical protein PILCRDRAFT_692915 [Piloderma croceum F 1598]
MEIPASWRAALLSAANTLRQEMMLQTHTQNQTRTPVLLESQVRDGELSSRDTRKEQQEEEERQCLDEQNSPSSAPCYLRDFSFGSESEPESESDDGGHSHSHPHPYTHTTTSSTSSMDLSFASNHALPTKLKLKPQPKYANGIEIENVGSGSVRRYKCRTVGRSAGRANANVKGRVRGMVESWERSGSDGEDVFGGGGSVEASTSSQADGAQIQIPIQEHESLGLGVLSAYGDDDGQLRSPPAHASEKEEPSIETLLSQSQSNHTTSISKAACARADLDFSPSSATDPGRDKGITIKCVSPPSHSHSPAPSSSSASAPDSVSVSVPVLFHNGAGDAFVDGGVRRVSGGSSVRSMGSIVGWDDDDVDDRGGAGGGGDKDGRSTMKHLPVPPADDNHKKSSMRSHARVTKMGTESRRGKGREERRVVTAIFSAEPSSGVVREQGGEAGFAAKTDTRADEPEDPPPANIADVGSAPPPPVAAATEITTHDKDLEAEQLELDVQRVLSISRGGSPWLLDEPQPRQPQPQQEADEKVKVREELERIRGNESQLGAELEATRILAGAFRKRLEEVERKIADMEIQHQRERELELEERMQNSSRLRLISPALTAASSTAARIGAATLVTRALSYIYILPRSGSSPSGSSSASTSTPAPPPAEKKRRNSSPSGDPPVSALPSYVLLVGIGVCAVVLRVVLRRAMRNTKA